MLTEDLQTVLLILVLLMTLSFTIHTFSFEMRLILSLISKWSEFSSMFCLHCHTNITDCQLLIAVG